MPDMTEPQVILHSWSDFKSGEKRWTVEIRTPYKTLQVSISPTMRQVRTFWRPRQPYQEVEEMNDA